MCIRDSYKGAPPSQVKNRLFYGLSEAFPLVPVTRAKTCLLYTSTQGFRKIVSDAALGGRGGKPIGMPDHPVAHEPAVGAPADSDPSRVQIGISAQHFVREVQDVYKRQG